MISNAEQRQPRGIQSESEKVTKVKFAVESGAGNL